MLRRSVRRCFAGQCEVASPGRCKVASPVGAKSAALIASATIRSLMPITTILFDADGVVQGPSPDRRAMWAEVLCGRQDDVDQFVRALFDVERTCYDGRGDFVAALPDLLRRWNCSGTVDDLLRAWTAIDVDAEVVRLITAIRSSGITCCPAWRVLCKQWFLRDAATCHVRRPFGRFRVVCPCLRRRPSSPHLDVPRTLP